MPLLHWGDDGLLAPHAPFDRFALRAHRTDDGGLEFWHGPDRYVRAGSAPRPLPEPPRELRAIAGHYRSHNPWTTSFRVVVRGDRAWLVFASEPDGFDEEQPLAAAPDGSFRVADKPGNPEHVRFDTEVGGRALRAWLSGWPYYRIG